MVLILIIDRKLTDFFQFLVLDKAVCPLLVKHFDRPLWHPTDEVSMDALMNAEVDM